MAGLLFCRGSCRAYCRVRCGGFAAVAVVLFVAAGTAMAGVEWSPELRIAGLEIRDGGNVLRVAVERRLEHGKPAFGFNPAGCPERTLTIKRYTRTTGATVVRHVFDLELELRGRTVAQREQMISELYGAFAQSRMVRLSTFDDRCTDAGTRAVAGVEVQF